MDAKRRRSKEGARLALVSEVVAVVGPAGVLVEVAPAAVTVLDRTPDELVGRSPAELVAEPDRSRLEAALALGRGGVRARPPHGRGRWIAVEIHPGAEAGAGASEVVLVIKDVSELVEVEGRLQAAEARYRALTEDLPDVVFAADAQGLLTHLNPSFERQTGVAMADVLGSNVADLVQPDERPRAVAALDDLFGGVVTVARFEGRYQSVFLGTLAWFEVAVRLVRTEHGHVTGTAGVIRDVTARKEAEVQMAHRARHDGLTGLLNRGAIIEHLVAALAPPTSGRVAVHFLDLDGFKQVNDRLGHEAGDALLADVGGRLAGALRAGEVAGRVGGDEFVVVSVNQGPVDGAVDDAVDGAVGVVERLHAALTGNEHGVTASIGVATGSGGSGTSGSALLRSADEAMYRAKYERMKRSSLLIG